MADMAHMAVELLGVVSRFTNLHHIWGAPSNALIKQGLPHAALAGVEAIARQHCTAARQVILREDSMIQLI